MEEGNQSLSHGIGIINAEEEYQMELPPGFRFHPTDEELITHYLSKKVVDDNFDPKAIGVVDLNKCEPWELPKRAKLGEKEWYFFCVRDRKYPTGLRTNRATDCGYWKATGKDKEIYRGKMLVGMKKTLVFYRGRAPRGEKSNWVMHEFRLEGKCSFYSLHGAAKNEWVICKLFKKSLTGNGKKAFGAMGTVDSSFSYGEEVLASRPSTLPPLMDVPAHVTCFSSAMEGHKAQDPELFRFFNPAFQAAPEFNSYPEKSSFTFSKFAMNSASLYGGGFMNLLEGDLTTKQGSKMEREMLSISQETGLTSDLNPEISSGIQIGRNHFEECIWDC